MVLKSMIFATPRLFNDTPEKYLKTKARNVYKSKCYIDYDNFILWYKNHFNTSKVRDFNYFSFPTIFLNK